MIIIITMSLLFLLLLLQFYYMKVNYCQFYHRDFLFVPEKIPFAKGIFIMCTVHTFDTYLSRQCSYCNVSCLGSKRPKPIKQNVPKNWMARKITSDKEYFPRAFHKFLYDCADNIFPPLPPARIHKHIIMNY